MSRSAHTSDRPTHAPPPLPAGEAAPRVRRAPRQARGAARIDMILDAAEEVIAAAGPDGASMNAIAKAAGTAPGSLYHFFPDKDALLDAIAERQAERFTRLHAEAIPARAVSWPFRRVLEHVLAQFAAFYDANPSFEPVRRAIARRAGGADQLRQRDVADNDVVTQALARLLEPRLPIADPAERHRIAHAMVAMADGVLHALDEQPPAAQRALVVEMIDALDAYFERVQARPRGVRGRGKATR